MPAFTKAKSHNWVEADNAFGEMEGGALLGKRKRNNNNTTKAKPAAKARSASSQPLAVAPEAELGRPEELWIARHAPRSAADLAVNAKKVEEVRQWLAGSVAGARGGLLVLTGPAGCGRTACLRVLCEELGLGMEEWATPVEQVDWGSSAGRGWAEEEETARWRPGDTVAYSGKAGQFKDWLRGAKYNSLSGTGPGARVILVEDLPSSAASRPEEFQAALEGVAGRAGPPLVLVVPEEALRGRTALLPADWLARCGALTIAFNPATSASLVKLLTRVALQESQRGVRRFRMPEKAALESLAESVGGDIRGAVNALQFSCLNEISDLAAAFQSVSTLASSKTAGGRKPERRAAAASSLSKIGGKDQQLQLFHALGKVLYAKREEVGELHPLPPQLARQARRQLKCCPEEVLERSTMTADPFTAFLHHNYPPFFSSIGEVSRLADYFSEADLFLKEWGVAGKIHLSEYGGSVAARAVMFCGGEEARGGGQRKLTKPEYYQAARTLKSRQAALSAAFPSQDASQLVTCSLPLLARLRHGVPPAKMATITDIASFPVPRWSLPVTGRATLPAGPEQEDLFGEEDEDSLLLRMCEEEEGVEVAEAEVEEEMVIEDFDDED